MKALTDKIKSKLQLLASECDPGSEFQEGLLTAITNIENEEKNAEFEEVARVMMKHLGNGEKYHPHHIVIISNSMAELTEGIKSTGNIMDYVSD